MTEPSSRVIQISSDRTGIITAINAHSGQPVLKDQILVQLDDSEQRAALATAKARLAVQQATLADVKAGTRPEEIQAIKADLEKGLAEQKFGQADFDRLNNLRTNTMDSVAVIELEKSRQYLDQSRAAVHHAQAELAKAQDGPTPTQLAVAEANVALAQAEAAAEQVVVDHRALRSPVAGIVLYVHMRPGEAVTFETPQPIVSLAEAGPPHLRASVNQADIGKIFVGQRVLASGEGYTQSFAGKVIVIEPIMGRPPNDLSLPRERLNTATREVVISLGDDADQLPIDLSMTANFLPRDASSSPTTAPAN
jgi:HlyD family secretion protein